MSISQLLMVLQNRKGHLTGSRENMEEVTESLTTLLYLACLKEAH